MGAAQREVSLAQAVAAADGLRQILRPVRVARLQRGLDRRAQRLCRNARHLTVDRNERRLVLDRRADELQRAARTVGLAVEQKLPPRRELILQPRLIVPDHRHDVLAIGDEHLCDQQLLRPVLPDFARDAHAHRRRFSRAQLAKRHRRGQVAIVLRQKARQIAHGVQSGLIQRAQARRADPPDALERAIHAHTSLRSIATPIRRPVIGSCPIGLQFNAPAHSRSGFLELQAPRRVAIQHAARNPRFSRASSAFRRVAIQHAARSRSAHII